MTHQGSQKAARQRASLGKKLHFPNAMGSNQMLGHLPKAKRKEKKKEEGEEERKKKKKKKGKTKIRGKIKIIKLNKNKQKINLMSAPGSFNPPPAGLPCECFKPFDHPVSNGWLHA